jgi:hypothetical protein
MPQKDSTTAFTLMSSDWGKEQKFHVLSNFSHSVNISKGAKSTGTYSDHISTSQITDFHLLFLNHSK